MDDAAIEDLFEGLGRISIRRMFGGKGIYHNGLIIAIDLNGDILLKADAVSCGEFAHAGSTRWAYEGKKGKPVLMPYWTIPEDAFDDPERMGHWTRLAYEAARRSKNCG